MKKVLLALSFGVVTTAFAAINNWSNDKAHSELGFKVEHLGVSEVSGQIKDFDVTVKTEKADFSDAVFELRAKVASVDTRVEMRDNHLKSADFFDAEKYPEIVFTSTNIKKAGKNTYKLSGPMTMHGVTKNITMDVVYNGTVNNPMSGKETAGFKVTGTINRLDFGIGEKFPEAVVSNAVKIEAHGEFQK
jgi:polyisoprenoid-binding protein YceI